MMRVSSLLACAALLAAAGCSTAPCKDGTLFVNVTLSGTAVDADSLGFAIALDSGQTLNASVAHTPGQGMGTVEISFAAGYPSGKSATVNATALQGSTQVGTGTATVTFAGGCQAVPISVTGGGNNNGDMAMSTGDGGLLANGKACGGDGQCESNHCVDGVCCNVACTGQCEACDVGNNAGTCTPITGAPHGTRPVCNGTGTCGGTCDGTLTTACKYPTSATQCRMQSCTGGMVTAAANCDGNGACPAPNTVNCNPLNCNTGGTACANSCTSDPQCSGSTPYCDTLSGACTPKKPNGRMCAASTECTSGSCVDGFCCDQGCGGSCQSCNQTGKQGTCTQLTSGTPPPNHPACQTDGTAVCTGYCAATSINCTYPTVQCKAGSCNNGTITNSSSCSNGSCPSQTTMTCTMGYNCDSTNLMCKTTCSTGTDCQTGLNCTSNGRCCPPATGNMRYVDAVNGVDDPGAGGGMGPCAYKSLTYAIGKSPNNAIIQTAGNDTYSAATTNETFPLVLAGQQQLLCGMNTVIKGNGSDVSGATTAVVINGGANVISGCTIDAAGGINSIAAYSPATATQNHIVQGNKLLGGGRGMTIAQGSGFITVQNNQFMGTGANALGFYWIVTTGNPGVLKTNVFTNYNTDITCGSPSPGLGPTAGGANSDPNAAGMKPTCSVCANCPFQ